MDPATIQAAKTGDRKARATLLRALADPWYRAAWAMSRDPELAKEAVQEAAMRLLRDVGQFRGASQFRTWAMGILINVVREQRRARRREIRRDDRVGDAESASAVVEREEEGRVIRELMADLPERQREAVVLRFFEEMSVEETAAAMGCAAGTVKATVHQALRGLRQKLMRPAKRS